MRLTRLYHPDRLFAAGEVVPLSPDQSHYLLRVLRMNANDDVVLFNEQSGSWVGVLQVNGKHAAMQLRDQIQQPLPPRDVHLLVAPIKKEEWQFVLEKTTELGVAAIQPVLTDYKQNSKINIERAEANLIEASQQCERTHIPQFFAPKKLDGVLAEWDDKRVLYAALEREDVKPLQQVIIKDAPAAILIGPEGGFSQREKELLLSKQFVRPVSLGPLILRAETAAIAALAIYQSVQD